MIKCRVWNKDEYISLSNAIYWNLVGVEHEDEANELKPFEEGVIIEQYTGLKDKNGVEIYEGDVVDINSTRWGNSKFNNEVVKNEGVLGFTPFNIVSCQIDLGYICSIDSKDVEIIGNIHEGGKND